MGRLFLISLEGKIYSCKHCQAHLALSHDIVSKDRLCMLFAEESSSNVVVLQLVLIKTRLSFHCRHGKAYLFDKIVNVTAGSKEERMMLTGLHTVSDIFCVGCGSNIGWKYVSAHEKNQKYKEGKFVLERFKLAGPDGDRYWITHDTHLGGSDDDDS
ncbi:hypothetical protein ZIOFF_058122 [Zingiber officinale]|uniref:Protein yippee-like n=1 Tax=Zingiber officinale TaxID=94328 RepID=A0A8J5KLL4_ZINOF|nr:hypothetical protein ZIOFF_058122 [Zingiber officinale]